MTRPTSSTAIANLALRHLKNAPITSISPPDSDSKAAASCAAWYDQSRRHCLEDHPWNFATKRVEIAAENDEPVFEYLKKYQVPSDFIRVGRLGESWYDPERDYEIEGDYIITDVTTPLKLVYVYDFENVSKFSSKFISCLAYKLAANMAYELTGNASLKDGMEQLYRSELTSAASVDGQNRPTRRIQKSKLADARQNLGRYRNWQSWET